MRRDIARILPKGREDQSSRAPATTSRPGMSAVFMQGDDVEWTLLDGDGEVAQVGETSTTEETLSQQQQHVEELRAALDRKEAELMRTREELRIARIDIARAATQSASAARPTPNNNNPHLRDGLWYASFPPEGASVSDAPVMVAVCVGCGYAKPAELLGVAFHEGIPHFQLCRGIPARQPRFKCSKCDTRRTAHAEGKLDQLIDMGFDRDAARTELRRSGGDVEKALRTLLA